MLKARITRRSQGVLELIRGESSKVPFAPSHLHLVSDRIARNWRFCSRCILECVMAGAYLTLGLALQIFRVVFAGTS